MTTRQEINALLVIMTEREQLQILEYARKILKESNEKPVVLPYRPLL